MGHASSMQGKIMVDMFAKEEIMLVDINDVIQLLFVLTQSPLTPGLISLHHQLISSTSLSQDSFAKLCRENSLHPPEYPRTRQWTNHKPQDGVVGP